MPTPAHPIPPEPSPTHTPGDRVRHIETGATGTVIEGGEPMAVAYDCGIVDRRVSPEALERVGPPEGVTVSQAWRMTLEYRADLQDAERRISEALAWIKRGEVTRARKVLEGRDG